jgi:vacuolar-type H+-ATPase subunit H
VEEIQNSPEKENNTSPYSLDGYRSKLEEIIRTENEKFRLLAEEQAKEITSEAWRKAEEAISQSQNKAAEIIGISEMKAAKIVGDSQQKAEKIIDEYKQKVLAEEDKIIQQAKKEASDTIEKANQEAGQIIRQAEENAREEAKNRVKSEREKILAKTRQESETIISSAQKEAAQIVTNAKTGATEVVTGAKTEASQIITSAKDEAEKQARDTVEKAKKEAELMIKDEIEKCRGETQTQATQIIKQTEKKAHRLINDIINDGKQLHVLIMNGVSNAENLMVKMKDEMQTEFGELTKQIVETNNKLEGKIDQFVRDNKGEIEGMPIVEIPNTSDDIWLIFKGEKSAAGNGNNGLFIGEIELKTLSSFDMRRIKNVKKLFTQIPSVEYIGEYSSEEGLKIGYKLQEPLQLLNILKDIPWIDRVVEEGDNLKLTIH